MDLKVAKRVLTLDLEISNAQLNCLITINNLYAALGRGGTMDNTVLRLQAVRQCLKAAEDELKALRDQAFNELTRA